MDRHERLAQIALLEKKIDALKAKKRKLLAHSSTANLAEEERKQEGEILDSTLAALSELSDQLLDLRNDE
jgi:Na+/phosphate symporter